MPLGFRETKQPVLIVGQDGILRATQRVPRQPAPAAMFAKGLGGLPTRRRLPTCPTTSAAFPILGKLSGIGPFGLREICQASILPTLLMLATLLSGATRPQYGGTLRVELRQNAETPDPPPLLGGGFTIARWEAGRLAVYEADDKAGGGRPFLDRVEVLLGRAMRDQASDLDLGKADVVELSPGELRRQPAGRRVWSSSPVRVLALVFATRFEDARVREALALAVDRSAIYTVLLQRQGEISGALLPQWLSGYAFLFPAVADLGRARQLAQGARPITLGVSDAAVRPIAERIALNARDAGLTVSVTPQSANADVVLQELRIASEDPAKALAKIGAALGVTVPRIESLEQVYAAERNLLEGFRVIPLIHLPDVYGVSPRVRGGPGIAPSGEWGFDNLWLDGARP